jgi:hypothetical protein
MRTLKQIAPLLFLLVGVSLISYGAWLTYVKSKDNQVSAGDSEAQSPLVKTIMYTVEIVNPGNDVIKNESVSISLPVESSLQKIISNKVTASHEIVTDVSGNQVAKVTLPLIAPYETKIVDVVTRIELSGSKEMRGEALMSYTKPEKFVESTAPDIINIANKLKGGKDADTARNTLNWISSHLRYGGYVKEDRGALYALSAREADCTEYMYLYAALTRANQIPTRLIGGFVVESNKKIKASEYHNWVEVYLDGKWRIVDPQNGKFLENEKNYIAMRYLGETEKTGFNHSQQMIHGSARAKISMM